MRQPRFDPRSPYAAAKVYAYWMTRNYREAYKLFASNGILFNHEIAPGAVKPLLPAKLLARLQPLSLASKTIFTWVILIPKRDWGYAPEYVEAMWMMLQQDQADDFVVGTGESHSIREFLDEAFGYVGMDWQKLC